MRDNELNSGVREDRNSSEFNKSAKEIKTTNEFKNSAELSGLRSTEENNNAALVEKKTVKRDASKTGQQLAGTAVVATASLVVIASSGLINLQMDGSINEIIYQDSGIRYSVNVVDVAPDNQLWFDVYDGQTKVATYEIVNENLETYSGDLEGFLTIDDLEVTKGCSYDFHLCGDTGLIDRTYDSWTLEIKELTSYFNGIENAHCECQLNGCFLFTLDFTDDYGLFSDFTATITDSAGNVSSCIFTENLHEEQRINVLSLIRGDVEFKLTYEMDGTPVEIKSTVQI